jgi:zinc/manganese transport system substrate-binding protein
MISKTLLFLAAFLVPMEAFSAVRVVATTPDIAWLVNRIGGKKVEVKTLAKANDDYHFLDARPDFILAVNRASVVCRVGADLELGWIPKILEKAANSKVMAGGAGDCDLSRAVSLQEKPTGHIDRSMGDVHPTGNPHFWLSPLEMANAAAEVEEKLAAADPGSAAEFAANRAKVQDELKALHGKIKAQLKPLSGKTVVEYHKDFFYFNRDYGLKSLGSIEEIPGVSPSAARLGKIALEAKRAGAMIALATTHSQKNSLEKFRELSGVKVVALPSSLSDPTNPEAYADWQNSMAEQILKALK